VATPGRSRGRWDPFSHLQDAASLTRWAVAEEDAVTSRLADLVGLAGCRGAGLVLAAARNGLVARARAGAGRQQDDAVADVARGAAIRGVEILAAHAVCDARAVDAAAAQELAYGSGPAVSLGPGAWGLAASHGSNLAIKIKTDKYAKKLGFGKRTRAAGVPAATVHAPQPGARSLNWCANRAVSRQPRMAGTPVPAYSAPSTGPASYYMQPPRSRRRVSDSATCLQL
jgi:hypothetical protein